jgi:hypothetical protein
MVYIKVVVFNIIYNFVVEKFLFKFFRVPNMYFKFLHFEILILEFSNDLKYSHG